MSSVFKGARIEQTSVEPFQLRDVAMEGVPGRPEPGVFQGLNDPEDPPEDTAGAESDPQPEAEAETVDREQIDQIEREAYAKAFELGEKTGIERGEQMFRSAVQSFVRAAEELKRLENEFYQRIEREILDLVLATTQKVVQREVDAQQDMILNVLKEAIAKALDRERIHVRVSPSDFDFVQAHKPEILQGVEGIKQLVIERDETVSRGGAIVESEYGTIDARIERRFEVVEKALRRQRGEGSDSVTTDEARQGEEEHAN